uniref:Uncharacterized protein n=1 Tax=Romanomermis culicivorax TaxID=13658 RepID=A0A915J888_ROMCU
MTTVTENSVETTSKNSAISTEDDLYLPRTIVPLLVICVCLLINYIFTYAAMLIKGGKDFHTSYYTLSKGLVWSDFAVLVTTACYLAARLYKNPSGRDHTLRYVWVFNGACAYFPGLWLFARYVLQLRGDMYRSEAACQKNENLDDCLIFSLCVKK